MSDDNGVRRRHGGRSARVVAAVREAALTVIAEKGLAKLERQLGRIVVPKTDNKGKCREVTQWVLPGNQIVSKDGQSQMVKVRAGEIINLGGCP